MRYRHLRRTAIAVLAAVAFVLLLGVLAQRLLTSSGVRRTAVNLVERLARERGLDLEIGSLQWGFVPPRVVVRDITLTDTEFAIRCDRLEVELTGLRVARRIIELRTVAAEGVRLELEGRPRPRPRRGRSLIRVAIRHLDLRDITFEGEELPGKIDLTVTGADVAWTSERATAAGFLSVARARLSRPSMEDIEVSLQSRLIVDDGVRFPAWQLNGDGVRLRGHGSIKGGALRLEAKGTVDLERAAETFRDPDLLRGTTSVAVSLDTAVDELVRLEVTSPEVTAAGFTFDDISARLTIERDRISGFLDRARFHGGRLSGSYSLGHLKGPTRPHRVRVSGDGVSLAALLDDLDVPSAGITGRVAVEGGLEWNGRSINRGNGQVVARLRPESGGLPVDGTVVLDLTPAGLLRFTADGLRIGQSVVDWQGPLTVGSWQPNWSIRAAPAEIGEVVSLVNGFVGTEVLPPWVAGEGTLLVTLSGPWRSLAVSARMDARPLILPPIELDQVVSEATISGSRLELGPTRFRLGDGTGEVDGTVAWGATAGADQIDLGIRGFRLPIATVSRWVGAPGQAEGALSFTGGLRGSFASPRGSWAVGFDGIRLLGQELGGGTASIDLADSRFDARALTFDGGLEGTTWWDLGNGSVGGHLIWPGMSLAALGATVSDFVGGAADLEIDFSVADGEPVTGHLRAECPDAVVEVIADPDTVTLDATAADSAVLAASLRRAASGEIAGDGTIRIDDAKAFITHLAPTSELPLSGTATASFDVSWLAAGLPEISGVIDAVDLDLDGRPVSLLSPSPFSLSPRGADFGGIHVSVRADEMFARGSIAADGSIAGNITGTLDALLLRILLPDWEPAGRAIGVVEILGTVEEPRFEGIAEVHQVSFRIPNSRTILSGVDGTVLLSSDEAILEGVEFRFMQGRGRSSGRIGRKDGTVDFSLNGTIEGLRYEVLPDVVAQLSGSWRLVGPSDDLEASGDLTVDSATLRTKEDLPTLVLRWSGGEWPAPARDRGLALDPHIEADETIELRNPSLRLVGSTSLDISGSTGRPGIVGKLEFAEGGEVTLQTLRYELERATLTFSDPDVIEPFIEIQARTFVQNYDITLRLTGTPQRLIPTVSSNPPLTEDEIYGLMAVGYRSSAATSGAMGIGFASSILSQQLAQELDRRAGLALPVDQVRVDPFAETTTGDPGAARITVVKQLNPSWTVTVQSNLSGEREEVVVSRWYLAPGIFVEASRDLDGTYGVDLKVRRQY